MNTPIRDRLSAIKKRVRLGNRLTQDADLRWLLRLATAQYQGHWDADGKRKRRTQEPLPEV